MAATSKRKTKLPAGIRERHARGCASSDGERCSCTPSYEALVTLGKAGERKRRTFATLEDAKTWRIRLLAAKTHQRLRAPAHMTAREAAETFLEGIGSGAIATRSGETYKPSTVRSYELGLMTHVLPELGRRAAAWQEAEPEFDQELNQPRAGAASTLDPARACEDLQVDRGDVAQAPTHSRTTVSTAGPRRHGQRRAFHV